MSTDRKINFLMGLHCHQPADNFKSIFEKAYSTSYEPFLSVLERHPKIKLSFHYSGSILDWIFENRPEFLKRIKRLVDAGQAELLTGGYFEPILPMIPPDDAKGQIEMLTSAIEKHFNFKPGGIWLAERVWDPGLFSVFKNMSDIKYAILDDFHLERAGVDKNRVFGHYTVSELGQFGQGRLGISVFASIKKLRYTMPFRDPQVTIDFLRGLHRNEEARSVTFADDCEKFGLWPHTYDWVYKKGWLEKFFSKLEESDWIETLTFSEALSKTAPLGEIDIPHSSYAEMSQWCNGDFNNFFRKYPESDLMRKRMLSVSERIRTISTPGMEMVEEARTELYKSQSNCAYWHGIFGGIYTTHLRRGIYSHIINAERLINETGTAEKVGMLELSACDGQKGEAAPKDIICARNKHLALFIDPDYAGSVFEMDYKPLSFNMVDTMSRRWEPYHEKLTKKSRINVKDLEKKTDEEASIDLYELLGVREHNLKRFLNYDSYRKSSALCHFMGLNTSFSDFVKSKHVNPGKEGLLGRHEHEIRNENGRLIVNLRREAFPPPRWDHSHLGGGNGRVRLNKRIILEKGAEVLIKLDLENASSERLKFLFGVEFNWSIEDTLFLRNSSRRNLRKIALVDKFLNIKIKHIFEKPMNLWSFPIFTLNESESGIGRNFQGISLLFHRYLALAKDEKFSVDSRIEISAK